MQWAKAKTIMIWVFLAVDIILLTVMASNKIGSGKKDYSEVIKVLENNNLIVREEIFDIRTKSVFANEFTGLTLNEDIVGKFLVNPLKIDNNTYEDSDKKAKLQTVSGYISYENESPDFKGFSGVNEKNINSKLQTYLKALKINKYVKMSDVYSINGDIYAEYSYYFNGKELFSSSLTFVVCDKGIKKIEGNINIPNGNHGYNFTLSNIETVLMNFVQNNNFTNKENIVSLTEGYFCINYENTLLSQAIPVYRIKTTEKTYIYDARDGIDYEKRQLFSK